MGKQKMPQEVLTMLQKLHENGILNWLVLLVISAWAGAVRYLSNLNGRKLVVAELFVEVFTSGFVGLIAGLVCAYYQTPASLSYAIAGIAAHYGTRSLYIIGEFIKRNSASFLADKSPTIDEKDQKTEKGK